MAKRYLFKQDIAGSNNGYTITEYKKNDVVEQENICEYLTNAWLKAGIIEEIGEDEAEKLKEISSDNAGEAGADVNGDKETNTPEVKENSTEDVSDSAELTDEKIGDLVYQAKEILEVPEGANLSDEDVAKLKQIGIELKIEGMISSKKPQTILDKINKYIDEYENIGEEIPLP